MAFPAGPCRALRLALLICAAYLLVCGLAEQDKAAEVGTGAPKAQLDAEATVEASVKAEIKTTQKKTKGSKPKKEIKPDKGGSEDRSATSSQGPGAGAEPDLKDAKAQVDVDNKKAEPTPAPPAPAPAPPPPPKKEPNATCSTMKEKDCGADKKLDSSKEKKECRDTKCDKEDVSQCCVDKTKEEITCSKRHDCTMAFDGKKNVTNPKPDSFQWKEVDDTHNPTECGLCYWDTSSWTEWSECAQGCGSSSQKRTREVRCLKQMGGKVSEVTGEATACCNAKHCKDPKSLTPKKESEKTCENKDLCNHYCHEYEWNEWEPSPKDAAVNERVRFRKVQCMEKHNNARADASKCDNECANVESKEKQTAGGNDAVWVADAWGEWEDPRKDVCGPYQITRTRRVACEKPDGSMVKNVDECNKWRKKPDSRDADDGSRDSRGAKPEESMLNSREDLIAKKNDTSSCQCGWVKTQWSAWSECAGDSAGCTTEKRTRKAKCLLGPEASINKATYNDDLGLQVKDEHCCGDGDIDWEVTKDEFVRYWKRTRDTKKAGKTTKEEVVLWEYPSATEIQDVKAKGFNDVVKAVEDMTPGKDGDDGELTQGEIEKSIVASEKWSEKHVVYMFEFLDKDGDGLLEKHEIGEKSIRTIENVQQKTLCCFSAECKTEQKISCTDSRLSGKLNAPKQEERSPEKQTKQRKTEKPSKPAKA
jgi:hypothetical protein